MQQLAPGLFRWTARHPEASDDPEPESPADWPADVGCVAHRTPEALVLVDPLVTDWAPLDALVDRPLVVLTTIRFHGRSRDAVAERYGATLAGHRDTPPAGVRRIPVEGMDETMVWLEGPRALVPGDRLIGDGQGGLRLCPESWLRYLPDRPALADLRRALRPLLELAPEMVLTSHGEPVLRDAHGALGRALAAY